MKQINHGMNCPANECEACRYEIGCEDCGQVVDLNDDSLCESCNQSRNELRADMIHDQMKEAGHE